MKNRSWICIFLFLILLCLGVSFLLPQAVKPHMVQILQDGQTLYTIDLSRVPEPYTLTAQWGDSQNIISVSPGSIAVTKADCGCQVCVEHGPLIPGGVPIICLPNRLVIRWAEGASVDAVS